MCKKEERTRNQHDTKSSAYKGIRDLAIETFLANNIYMPVEIFVHCSFFGNAQVKICRSPNRNPKILGQVGDRTTNPSAKNKL
jgi:hypothetical protein